MGAMRLIDLTPAERNRLAAAVGCSPKYLYQVATGVIDMKTGKSRQMGPELCRRIVEAEPRLTLHELRPDIWEPVTREDT